MKKVVVTLALVVVWQFCFSQKEVTRIAFGSCSEENTQEQMWADVVAQKPQLWIWLGDNVYADTHDMNVLRAQYQKQKTNPEYQKLLQTCPCYRHLGRS